LRMAASANLSGHTQPAHTRSLPMGGGSNLATAPASGPLNGRIVCIGASTGGVDALQRVLTRIPANGPPILITQHMPEGFLRSFSARLDPLCPPKVILAGQDMPLEPGTVYIAPGGNAHLTVSEQWPPRCRIVEGEKVSGHRPSVDVLFRSAVVHGPRAVGVLLTGMGQDGAKGLKEMRTAGAPTLVQDEATSVVFGMPRVALELGAADHGLPLDKITDEIMTLCTTARGKSRRDRS
ncbi:MAG: CheB methylesterase domain-containing protein, partial [Mangrovicoccus sp.]|nr:CheB methylesterase domain-containing protein [Mangrovicoccus sp.]